jgi:hypothetical protein
MLWRNKPANVFAEGAKNFGKRKRAIAHCKNHTFGVVLFFIFAPFGGDTPADFTGLNFF